MSEALFKFFPVDVNKEPLVRGWQQLATTDPETLKLWQDMFRGRIAYWGVPTGSSTDLLVLDVDMKDGRNGLSTLQENHLVFPQTAYQQTRSGGYHYFFQYPKDGKRYGNKVNFLPGLDVRGEGGYIVYYSDQVASMPVAPPPDWLLQKVAGPVIDHSGATIRVAPDIAQRIVEQSLDAIREAPEGESNNTLNVEAFRLGQLVASQSITREYARDALYRAAKERGKPDREAWATIDSGLQGGASKPLTSPFPAVEPVNQFPIPPPPGPPERWTPPPMTRQELLDISNLRRPQLFKDWSTEDIHITTADGGVGKTTLKLFEAVCLALGERFLGFDCKQRGKTLYITGEDSDKKLKAIIGQIVRQMGLFEDIVGNNDKIQTILDSIVIKKDAELCLIAKDRQGFLHLNSESMRKVLEAVQDVQPKLIVFDPIASFWGSEAALNDMAKAIAKFTGELVEKSGACVEMINHAGKASSSSKDMTQFAGRGGTGLPSHSRVSRTMREILDDEYEELTGESLPDNMRAILCNVNKFSDGSPLYNKPFIILRDGYLFSRKNLTPQKEAEAQKQMTDMERVFAFVKEQRSSDRYPTKTVVVGHFLGCGDKIPEKRVKIALDQLVYMGHMGERLKLVENPDQTSKDKVYVITDMEGKE